MCKCCSNDRPGPGYTVRHDYKRVPGDTARVDERRINELLSLRVDAKRAGDFPRADMLRSQLRQLGVEVLDRERQWQSCESRGNSSAEYTGLFDRFGEAGHDYTRVGNLDTPCDLPQVQKIMAQRLHARLSRDFAVADSLRETLKKLGVEVTDKDRTWEVTFDATAGGGGEGGEDSGGYARRDDGVDHRGRGRAERALDDDDDEDDDRGGRGRARDADDEAGAEDDDRGGRGRARDADDEAGAEPGQDEPATAVDAGGQDEDVLGGE